MLQETANVKGKTYFNVEKRLLKIAGISVTNNENNIYKVYSLTTLFLFAYGYPFVVSVDLFKRKFNDAIDDWFYAVGTMMGIPVITATYLGRHKLGALLNKLEEKPFLPNAERGGPEEERLIEGWLSFSHKQGVAFAVGVAVSLISQMIYTLIKRIMSSDYHDWNMGFAHISVLNATYSPNYEIVLMYQNFSICHVAINVCCTTLIISGIFAFTSTQFKMLQNNLRRLMHNSEKKMLQDTSISESSKTQSESIPWRYIKESVREAVSYHLDILKVVNELEEIYSNAILTIFVFTFLIVCIQVYRASMLPPNDIATFRVLLETITASFHALIICYSGQNMASESEEIANAAYDADFVGADLRLQKSLIIIIARAQLPMTIKAGKLIEISMPTFVWLIRRAYSAYMVLRNVNMPELQRN